MKPKMCTNVRTLNIILNLSIFIKIKTSIPTPIKGKLK